MARPKVSVEELLVRHRAIDDDQLRDARERQKKVGGDLGRVLVELGYVSEELLLRAQSHQLGIPLVDPAQSPPPRELARALPEQLCKRFGVIPVSGNLEAKLLRVATSAPANADRLASLAQESGFRIEVAAATADSIARATRAAFSESAGAPAPAAEHPEIEPMKDDELLQRLERLEKMLANPAFAGLVARVERLEQIAERDHHALNVLGQVLLDLGFITRDDLRKRLQKP